MSPLFDAFLIFVPILGQKIQINWFLIKIKSFKINF